MKPRLTSKVMNGLMEMAKLAEEFEKDRIWSGTAEREVGAAINWVQRMFLYRVAEAERREKRHHISKRQEALGATQEEG